MWQADRLDVGSFGVKALIADLESNSAEHALVLVMQTQFRSDLSVSLLDQLCS
jgi:hypothetical protein